MSENDSCTFCRIVAGQAPASVVYRDEHCWAFMDISPASPGHVLIVPTRHAVRIHELEAELRRRIWDLGHRVAAALRAGELPADGLSFLLNDGRAANQTVPHVHLHVIPRVRRDLGKVVLRVAGNLLIPRPVSRRRRAVLDAHAKALGQLLPPAPP